MYKIAVLWPGEFLKSKNFPPPNITLYEHVGSSYAKVLMGEMKNSDTEAIITTAGIGKTIQSFTDLPVYIVYADYMDMIESILHVEREHNIINQKIGMILHANNNVSFRPERIVPFIHNELIFCNYSDPDEIPPLIHRLMKDGCAAVLGGPTTITAAQALPVPAFPFFYNESSLTEAIERTKVLLELNRKSMVHYHWLQTAIDLAPGGIIGTDEHGCVNLCNSKALNMLGMKYSQVLGNDVNKLTRDDSWKRVYTEGLSQSDVMVTIENNVFFSARKPIVENGHIIGAIGTLQEAEKIQKMEQKLRSLQARGLTAKYRFEDIATESPAMRKLIDTARVFAGTDFPVLIEGETGTGKELFAQSIHNASSRKNGPFVAINCAALTESLLESELMGYEEGAFTSAKRGGKMGLFELAHNGTIFLDEINSFPMQLQAKLLRVIQEKVVVRLGGERAIPVDTRILTATNVDLNQLCQNNAFRLDLFYRINMLRLQIPPLRERREDLPVLVKYFLNTCQIESECTAAMLLGRIWESVWPGNVRELQNYVWRNVVLFKNTGQLEQGYPVGRGWQGAASSMSASAASGKEGLLSITVQPDTLERMKSTLVKEIMRQCNGNKTHAALLLDVTRNTISNILDKNG